MKNESAAEKKDPVAIESGASTESFKIPTPLESSVKSQPPDPLKEEKKQTDSQPTEKKPLTSKTSFKPAPPLPYKGQWHWH